MKYLKLFKTESDRDAFLGGGDLILPNVSVVEGKKDVIYKKYEKKLFPLTLIIPKINSKKYQLDPTPESIALCDYILNNGVWDGINTDVKFNSGNLYIQLEGHDANEVTSMTFYNPTGEKLSVARVNIGGFGASGFWVWDVYVYDAGNTPKGTIERYYDD